MRPVTAGFRTGLTPIGDILNDPDGPGVIIRQHVAMADERLNQARKVLLAGGMQVNVRPRRDRGRAAALGKSEGRSRSRVRKSPGKQKQGKV